MRLNFIGPQRVCLALLIFFAGVVWAAEKPVLLVTDAQARSSNFPDRLTAQFVSEQFTGQIASALGTRFKSCAGLLSKSDLRTILSWEKEKALLGSDDPSTLAEIGGALGHAGLLVKSSITYYPDSGWSVDLALLSTNDGARQGSASATSDDSHYPLDLAAKVVAGLPDLCAPMWGGKISVQYLETLKSDTKDTSSDVKFFQTIDYKLGIESAVYPLALSGETKQVSGHNVVSGAFKSNSHRISQALCGGPNGPEKVVPEGYRFSSYVTSSFGPVIGQQDPDESSLSFGLQIYPQRGVYTLNLIVPSVRYVVDTQARTVLDECGKATTEVAPSIPSEQTWAGTRFTVERGFKKDQTKISGGDSTSEASPGMDGAKTTTAYQWDLYAKPYIEYLIKATKK